MAIRNVLLKSEPQLRQISREVTEFDQRLSQFIDDLLDTMNHQNGVGLAAPQVGVLRRVCVISPDEGKTIYELVNPIIVKEYGKQVSVEGCLSIPNYSGKVRRPRKIVVEYRDRNGSLKSIQVEGFLATIFCHEIDHLDGILFSDKVID